MTEPEETPKKQRVYPRDASGKRVPTSKIVEAIRGMLSQGASDGDIKRQLAERYGMRPRSFEKHVAAARRRNRESIGLDQHEAKSASVSYWTSKLQTSERVLVQSQIRLQDTFKRLDQAQATLDDPDSIPEQREAAEIIATRCTDMAETLRKQIHQAQRDATDFRDRLDRILGTLAPIKHSQTTTDGLDVQPSAPVIHICEPSSMESAGAIISEILRCLPEGWYIANEKHQRLLADGSFEGAAAGDVLLLPPPK